MKFRVDQRHPGTSESAWQESRSLARLPPVTLGHPGRVLVIAPHPDDEILGSGGMLQSFIASGIPVEFLAVTDGERSHPAMAAQTEHLRSTRRAESDLAIRRLGCSEPKVTRLGIADGRVADAEERVRRAVEALSGEGDLLLAPWWLDGHPDHDACGRATALAAEQVGARCLHYLVWAWHWADPLGQDIPWVRCRRFDFGRACANRKSWSIEAYASQLVPLRPGPNELAVLPPSVLVRFQRTFEVFVEGGVG